MVYNNILELVGKTPIVRLDKFKENNKLNFNVFGKLESFNPAGSAKDRVALKIIEDAEKSGRIKKGSVIIEPTSGNTGIGLAMVGRVKGYKVILTMPDNMSRERISLLKAYGAEVVLTEASLGMKGAIEKAKEIALLYINSFIPGQFTNYSNVLAHYETTGPEIWSAMDGKIDYLVVSIGTGGTITGTAKFLKEKNKDIKVIGIEPKESPLITTGRSGIHGIQGIGANFIPNILDLSLIDKVETVSTDEAYEAVREIAELEGILVGISSGSVLAGIKKLNLKGNVVLIFPDSGERYLSNNIF